MNTNFQGKPSKSINDDIQKALTNCDKASMVLTHVSQSSANVTLNSLSIREEKSKPDISIVAGFDYCITDANALLQLIQNGVKCYLLGEKLFNSNMYFFEKGEDVTLIIGFANLNDMASSADIEANVIIEGKVSDETMDTAKKYLSLLESKSFLLEEHSIGLYRRAKQRIDEVISETRINKIMESLKYDLNAYLSPFDENINLTDHDYHLLSKIRKEITKANSIFDEGRIHESIELLQEIDSELMSLDEPNSLQALSARSECNYYLSNAFSTIKNTKNAKYYAIVAEKIGEKLYKNGAFVYPYLLGLGCSAQAEDSADQKELKCDEFRKLHHNNKEEIDDYLCDYSLLGETYLLFATLKSESGDIDLFEEYVNEAIFYVERDMEVQMEDFYNFQHYRVKKNIYSIQYCRLRCQTSELISRIINEESKEFYNIYSMYREAFDIAKYRLKSDFWEGIIRTDIAEYLATKANDTEKMYYDLIYYHLERAEEIFKNLNYHGLIEHVQNIRKQCDVVIPYKKM
jgi:HKD family nuclease